jgi:hypothetical protein
VLALDLTLFAVYLLITLFMLISYKEFFIGKTLRRNILLYAVPHILLIGMIGSFAYLFITRITGEPYFFSTLILFGMFCYLIGLIFEISRKMHHHTKVLNTQQTFSKLLGYSVSCWFLACITILASGIVALLIDSFIIRIILLTISVLSFLVLVFKEKTLARISGKTYQSIGAFLILYLLTGIILGGWLP